MGRWLERLRKKTRISPPRSPTKLTESRFVSFVSGQSGNILKNTAHIEPIVDTVDCQGKRSAKEESTRPTTLIQGVRGVECGRVGPTDWRGKATCWACKRQLWGLDRQGVQKCGVCHPPSHPDQVRWYDDEAEAFEERQAIQHEPDMRSVAISSSPLEAVHE